MAYQIQIRRDNSTNWTGNNPTLAQGEFGFETDTTKIKMGDGTTAWTSLPYGVNGMMVYPGAGIPVSTGSAWSTSITDNHTNWNTAYSNMISTLTTTGTSGAASLISGVLNIPNYAFTNYISSITTTGNSGSSSVNSGVLNVPTYTLSGLGGQPLLSGTGVVNSTSGTISYLGYGSNNNGSYLVQRDSNGNASFNNISLTSTQTSVSGQTITMTYGSAGIQQSIGTGSITYKLPDATYLIDGTQFAFNNDCTGTLTIQNWAGTQQYIVPSGGYATAICTNNSTQTGGWDIYIAIPNNITWGTSGLSITGTLSISGTSTFNTSLSGIAKLTSGVLSTATAGTDYQAPITLTTTGSTGAATFTSNTLNIPVYSSGGMTWPTGGAGIPNYSGSSSWGTSYTTSGTGTVLALITSPSFTTPSLGVATATSINGNIFTAGSSTYTGTVSATYTFPTSSKTIAANDGSNWTISGQAIGDIPVASSTTAYGKLAAVAAGSLLASNGTGVAPQYVSTIPSSILGNSTIYIGTTGIALNRASAGLTLAGITLTAPTLGAATTTTINLVTITQPATSATLTIANTGSLITSGAFAITLTATATSTVTMPASTAATLNYYTSAPLTANLLAYSGASSGLISYIPTPSVLSGLQQTNNTGAPVWTTATGTGAPVNAASPGFTGIVNINQSSSPTYGLEIGGATSTSGIRTWTGLDFYQVPNPTTLSGVIASGSNLGIGAYYYAVSYKTALGQTTPYIIGTAITTTSGNQSVVLTVPVSTDMRVIGRNLFRCKVGGGGSLYSLATISDNVTTSYTDTIADASLTGVVYNVYNMPNTSNKLFTVNGSTSIMIDPATTWLGYGIGGSITNGGKNVYIGSYAGAPTTSGNSNVAVGYQCGYNITTGYSNTYIGNEAGYSNATGNNNTAVGLSALLNGSNSNSTAVGESAGQSNGASNCNYFGYSAGKYNTTANSLYVDNQDRTNTAGDQGGAIVYGLMNATPVSQTLNLNAQVSVYHLIGNASITGHAAPVAVVGVGAGTGSPTATCTGTDVAGIITVLTGSSPTGSNAVIATVTFNTTFASAPYVIITPASATAAALAIGAYPVVIMSNTLAASFVLSSGATALTATTTYVWYYHIIQ